MKHTDDIGIDGLQEKLTGKPIQKGEFYEADPMGIRTGNGPGHEMVGVFNQVIQDAESVLDQVRSS